jgi:hypothetical protein
METREANYSQVFNNRIGFGERCCVLVIDFIKAYTTAGAPFFAEGVVSAVQASVGLLASARAANVPVIYTKVLYHPSGADGGLFVRKVPALRNLVEGQHAPHAGYRHYHPDRLLHQRLRAGDRRRCDPTRLPPGRSARMRRRPPRQPARRQPVRHPCEIRRRVAPHRGSSPPCTACARLTVRCICSLPPTHPKETDYDTDHATPCANRRNHPRVLAARLH